jgi:hypothetical protein
MPQPNARILYYTYPMLQTGSHWELRYYADRDLYELTMGDFTHQLRGNLAQMNNMIHEIRPRVRVTEWFGELIPDWDAILQALNGWQIEGPPALPSGLQSSK